MTFPKTTFKKLILASALLSLLFGTAAVFAAENCKMTSLAKHEPTIDWPQTPFGSQLDANTDLPNLVKYLFEWGVGLGGLAMFIALIIAGIQLITSVADPGKLNDAKERIKSAVIGLALLLSSWAIFNLINPNLNKLQDVTQLMQDIKRGAIGIDSDRTCDIKGLYAWQCCQLPITECNPATDCASLPGQGNNPLCCMDSKCQPENYACCQQNDANCIAGKRSAYIPPRGARWEVGENCTEDHHCKSNYCQCDRSEIPWKQKCADNPLVCVQVIGTPEDGCDFIAFYSDVNFEGEVIYVEVKKAENGWFDNITSSGASRTGIGFNEDGSVSGLTIPDILSFQAFKAAKNRTGSGTAPYIRADGTPVGEASIHQAQKIPCGEGSCGCKIEICDGGKTTAKSGCLRGTLIEYGTAYAPSIDPNIDDVVKIYDPSRSGLNQIKSILP